MLAGVLTGCATAPSALRTSADTAQVQQDLLAGESAGGSVGRIVYSERLDLVPPASLRVALFHNDPPQEELHARYGPYVQSKGWSLVCVLDRGKQKLFVLLAQDGTFVRFSFLSLDDPQAIACRQRGRQV
jgi:hypothetical protein